MLRELPDPLSPCRALFHEKKKKPKKRTRYSVRNIPDKTPVVLRTRRSSSSVFFFLIAIYRREPRSKMLHPHLRAERGRRVVSVACDPGETKQTQRT